MLGDDEVLPRHADALEDVGPVRRPFDRAEHDLLERVHVTPVEGALGGREDDVARLATRRPDLLDDDERAPEQARSELAPVRLVRPDGHDARTVGDPVVAERPRPGRASIATADTAGVRSEVTAVPSMSTDGVRVSRP